MNPVVWIILISIVVPLLFVKLVFSYLPTDENIMEYCDE